MADDSEKPYVCPWWIGYFLLNPLRRLVQHPEKILAPFVHEGMTVLEVGPGMGFFTLTLARLVGSSGSVICVDVQERMLSALRRRADRVGLEKRLVLIHASDDSLRIEAFTGKVDFALAFAVAHEVPDRANLFEQMGRALKPGGLLLFSEPTGHVTPEKFRLSTDLARSKGFVEERALQIKKSLAILLRKSNNVE